MYFCIYYTKKYHVLLIICFVWAEDGKTMFCLLSYMTMKYKIKSRIVTNVVFTAENFLHHNSGHEVVVLTFISSFSDCVPFILP